MSNLPEVRGEIGRRGMLRLSAGTLAGAMAAPFIARHAIAASDVAGKTIGFSQSYVTTNWIKDQRDGVIQQAHKYGLKTIMTDADHQPAKQITDLEDLITRRVDVILISTYFAEAIAPAIREINRAGIPIVVLSSTLVGKVDYTVHLGTDTLATARAAGEYYVRRLNGKGNVVEINGSPGSTVNQQRTQGFHDVVDKVPGIKIVGEVDADYDRAKALRGMEDMLQAHPHIDAVYAHSEDMAMGALQAVKEAGRLKEIWITGYDAVSPEILQNIYQGEIAGAWYYAPFGTEGVEAAVGILRGDHLKKDYSFRSPFVSKDNILDFFDPATRKAKVVPSRLEI